MWSPCVNCDIDAVHITTEESVDFLFDVIGLPDTDLHKVSSYHKLLDQVGCGNMFPSGVLHKP